MRRSFAAMAAEPLRALGLTARRALLLVNAHEGRNNIGAAYLARTQGVVVLQRWWPGFWLVAPLALLGLVATLRPRVVRRGAAGARGRPPAAAPWPALAAGDPAVLRQRAFPSAHVAAAGAAGRARAAGRRRGAARARSAGAGRSAACCSVRSSSSTSTGSTSTGPQRRHRRAEPREHPRARVRRPPAGPRRGLRASRHRRQTRPGGPGRARTLGAVLAESRGRSTRAGRTERPRGSRRLPAGGCRAPQPRASARRCTGAPSRFFRGRSAATAARATRHVMLGQLFAAENGATRWRRGDTTAARARAVAAAGQFEAGMQAWQAALQLKPSLPGARESMATGLQVLRALPGLDPAVNVSAGASRRVTPRLVGPSAAAARSRPTCGPRRNPGAGRTRAGCSGCARGCGPRRPCGGRSRR